MSKEQRAHVRRPMRLGLNYRHANGGNFLYERGSNISDGGIFIETSRPLPVGTTLTIRFPPPSGEAEVEVEGTVAWVNAASRGTPNPGMGISWSGLDENQREVVASVVRAIAIL